MLHAFRAALAILLLSFLAAQPAWAARYSVESVPDPKQSGGGYVSNPDGVLSTATVAQINQELAAIEHATGAQVAVVAIDDIEGGDIFSFSHRLFSRWGIGHAQRDDGLLILLVKDRRTVRFHTGYGLEGVLPDVVCKRIQEDDMLPAFRTGDYDAGMFAGVRRVDDILRDPAYAAQFAKLASPTHQNWLVFRNIGMFVVTIVSGLGLLFKSLSGYFNDSRPLPSAPPKTRYPLKHWLALFMLGPMLVLYVSGFIPTDSPILVSLACLYAYLLVLALLQIVREDHHVARLLRQHSYTAIARYLQRQRGFWTTMAVLFPLPLLLYRVGYTSRIWRYRAHPRNCPTCKAPMQLLSEAEEDAFLSSGQQVEEQIRSADHDVWHCTACGKTALRTFEGEEAGYDTCNACGHLTRYTKSDTTLVEPTYERRGKGRRIDACKHCGDLDVSEYDIARLTRSSASSSGGSSGSSGSGSWGGGSSGGGGSSSSW